MKSSDRILRFIHSYIEEHGYAPTIREIGNAVYLASTSTVHGHVQRLVDRGLLSKEAMLPRTVGVVGENHKVKILQNSGDIPSVIEWHGRIYELREK
jgi:SOS-response transcriptional repressor LexA